MGEKASDIIGSRRSAAGTNVNLSDPTAPASSAPAGSGSSGPSAASGSQGAASPAAAAPAASPVRTYERQKSSSGEEKNWFSKLFSFSGRLGRGGYWILVIVWNAFVWSASAIPENTDDKWLPVLWCLIFLILIWIRIAGNARRCHDMNRSGWLQLIPFYVIWMLLAPGEDLDNRYDD